MNVKEAKKQKAAVMVRIKMAEADRAKAEQYAAELRTRVNEAGREKERLTRERKEAVAAEMKGRAPTGESDRINLEREQAESTERALSEKLKIAEETLRSIEGGLKELRVELERADREFWGALLEEAEAELAAKASGMVMRVLAIRGIVLGGLNVPAAIAESFGDALRTDLITAKQKELKREHGEQRGT
jgi:hypothetical protein